MRDLVALVFNYSVNGLLADPDTDFWTFCFSLLDEQGGASSDEESLGFLRGAAVHLMGRSAYEGMSQALPAGGHPWSAALNAGRKVVVSTTLQSAAWEGTTIVRSLEEVEALREGDGTVIVWGGVRLWKSLMQRDLIDEFRFDVYPYLTSRGTVLFDEVPEGYRLDLVASTASPTGLLDLRYRRHR